MAHLNPKPAEVAQTPGRGLLARGRETFGVLGESNYRWYWLASLAYYTGLHMEMLARAWLAWELTESAWLLGWVVLSQGAPSAIMALLGGTLADRIPKRALLMGAQLSLAGTGAAVWLLLVSGHIEWWNLALLGLVKGASTGISLPARLAMVSEVVEEHKFLRAYALYYVALNTLRIGGPSIAGAIIWLTGGAAGAYAMITLAHLVCLVLLLPVRSLFIKEITHRPSFLQGLGSTFALAWRTPTILVLLGAELGIVFFSSPSTNLLPVFTARVFFPGGDSQVTAGALAALQVAQGVGGLTGSVLVAGLSQVTRKPLMLLTSGVAMGVTLIMFSSTSLFPLAVAFIAIEGITRACYTTLNSTLFQVSAPADMRGRAMSLYLMGNSLQPLGLLPISAFAEAAGVQIAVGIAGALLIGYMLAVMLLFPSFRRRQV